MVKRIILFLSVCFSLLPMSGIARNTAFIETDSLVQNVAVVADSRGQICVGETSEVSILHLCEPKVDSIFFIPGFGVDFGFDKPYIWTGFGNLVYVKNGCRNIPVFAKYEDGVSSGFKNPFTIVGLRLKKDDSVLKPLRVKQIVFTGNNGEVVAGGMEVDMSEDFPKVNFYEPGEGEQALVLDCAEGVELTAEPEIFYMAVPAINYSRGYKFTVVTDREDAKMAVFVVSDPGDATWAVNKLYGITEGVLAESDFKRVIPDPVFRAWLQELRYVKEKDELTGEVKITWKGRTARKILCNNMIGWSDPPPAFWGLPDLSSLAGIGYFRQLRVLECEENGLGVLDVSCNKRLKRLNCRHNGLKRIDLTGNLHISKLNCSGNLLSELDVTMLDKLTRLDCSSNDLEALDLRGNPLLSELICYGNDLVSVNLTQNNNLFFVDCRDNLLTELDVSQNPILDRLKCDNNPLTKLDISHNSVFTALECNNNRLTMLNVSRNSELRLLSCNGNRLTKLDVSQNSKLEVLGCAGNQLTELDVSHNPELSSLSCGDNRLTVLNVAQNPLLTSLRCDNNLLPALDVSKNLRLMYIDCSNNPFSVQPNVAEHERLLFYKIESEPKGKWLEWKKKYDNSQ